MTTMITPEQAADIRKRYDAVRDWLKANKTNGYRREELIAIGINPPENDELADLEIYEFMSNPPDHYFTYVLDNGACVGTWSGKPLSTRISLGFLYRDNFGGMRRSVRFLGINGVEYVGTYYTSAGDYCRVRRAKRPIWK
jgi:hypothetical protein